MRPAASSKTRSAPTLSASLSAWGSASSRATPTSTSSPGPIEATSRPSTAAEARSTRWTSALNGPSRELGGKPLAIERVVAALRPQIGRDRQVAARPVTLASQGERAAEAELREVVDRVALDDGLELSRRLRVAAAVEVGTPERLSDRALLRGHPGRLGQRNGSGRVIVRLEQGDAAAVEVVEGVAGFVRHQASVGRRGPNAGRRLDAPFGRRARGSCRPSPARRAAGPPPGRGSRRPPPPWGRAPIGALLPARRKRPH